jgi:hypothetical protein
MTIRIYPSALLGEPIETHEASGSLHAWLTDHCPSYRPNGGEQPIAVFVGGEQVSTEEWGALDCGSDIEIRPRARGFDPITIAIIAFVAAVAVGFLLRPSIPRLGQNGRQGQRLQEAALTANTPKPNGVIPEVAGRHKVFPDYLVQPRRYFTSPTKQALDVLLCVGRGEFAISDDDIRIGETRITDLTDVAGFQIFGPGASVAANPAHRNWYNAPEVGSTTGSAGLRMTAGASGTPSVVASTFVTDGNSIVIPAGAGIAPQDWEVGNIVSIVARIRTIEIVDGGGTIYAPLRDKVRGSFAGLGLTAGDVVLMYGVADGRYRVNSITSSVSIAGTASTVTAVKIAPLAFLSDPISLQVGAYDVILDEDYADYAAMVTAINGQIAGVVCSHAGGVLKLTEQSPYSGLPINLAGYYEPILGAAPNRVTGTATQNYDELTLDTWQQDSGESGTVVDGNGDPVYVWQPATSLPVGVHSGVEILRPRVMTVTVGGGLFSFPVQVYSPTEYRITSLISGAILDGGGAPITATIGWDFQRLNPDGTDDVSWVGFAADASTPNVTIELDRSQVVGGWLGPFRATPRNETSSLIEFDVFAPQGIGYLNDGGTIDDRIKAWELQWRSNGGVWTAQTFSVRAATRDQCGYTFQVALPSALSGVEVRIRRIGAEQTDLKSLDRLEWYGLRSLLPAPTSYAGVTTMALTISGSDAIASATENQINLIATRKINGVATRSIAGWVRHVCEDIGYGADDIDGDELARLGATWESRGDQFDFVFSDQATVRDALAMALRAGYSELTIDDGRIRPVRDEPRGAFEHIYTPQNMTAPLTRQFVSYDPDDHDGVDVEYVDAESWTTQVIECRLPGDVGIRVRKIDAEGITDRARAWRLGMRQRRIDAYRRKRYSFSTEWDALNSRYLSYCALADDVPGYGQSSVLRAIAPASNGYVLTLSEPMGWQSGASHVIGLRRPDGTLCGPFPATKIDDYRATISGALDFDPITAASSTEPTHALFGTSARWSYPVLITEITPQGDSVDVTAANYDARIYADDDNEPS